MILLLVDSELQLSFLNFVLNARFGRAHLSDVVLFANTDALSPLRVTTVELAQKLVLRRLQGLFGALQVLIDRLYGRVGLCERLIEGLLPSFKFHSVGLNAPQFVPHFSILQIKV